MLAENSTGDHLLRFAACSESDIDANLEGPLPLALVAVRRQGLVLLVFDRWKQVWELPGGVIEADESPREAALRELQEETGMEVQDLDFVGLATYRLRRGSVEHGALFVCEASDEGSFEPNGEIAQIAWWDRDSVLEGLDQLDAYLARHFA